jgi:hypothetical protein
MPTISMGNENTLFIFQSAVRSFGFAFFVLSMVLGEGGIMLRVLSPSPLIVGSSRTLGEQKRCAWDQDFFCYNICTVMKSIK